MTPDTRLKRADNIIATDMNGETVMMHIEKGTYFALTGSGGQIWTALERPVTLAEVVALIEDECDVSEADDYAGEVRDFIEQLIERGLVEPAD